MPSIPLEPTAPSSERIDEIIRLLHLEYPDACCELNHKNPFELLVATILSAQCTDVRVNKVTPDLFATYPTPVDFAAADRTELEEAVRSTGFYRNKTKNIQEASARIVHEYEGEVPDNMDDLLSLAGVARKTANVVLGTAYGIADGIVVDTHVKRLSNLLGLTSKKDPKKIEKDLTDIVPQSEWIDFSHLLIFHGRRVCIARRPACADCVLNHLCPSASL